MCFVRTATISKLSRNLSMMLLMDTMYKIYVFKTLTSGYIQHGGHRNNMRQALTVPGTKSILFFFNSNMLIKKTRKYRNVSDIGSVVRDLVVTLFKLWRHIQCIQKNAVIKVTFFSYQTIKNDWVLNSFLYLLICW